MLSWYVFCIVGERQNALESAAQEGMKFHTSIAEMLHWLSDTESKVESLEPVSGDHDVLVQQNREYEVCVSVFCLCLYTFFLLNIDDWL